ncbi:uncharacterized protein LOC126271860 [Schistocerca gregaria]|uniref:uncharacterized protein LOC126271860 n=1 Tax=Schistocerca gregaria TaxID=7010 RepID=UPI00211E2998|nr:uncharacterized protein LOC126271860 [Schistocerca gregaria]
MKFRSKSLRYTTYNLLTEPQKRSYHLKALLYLQKETQRCTACGGGTFECLSTVTGTLETSITEMTSEDGGNINSMNDNKENGYAGLHRCNIESGVLKNSNSTASSDHKESPKKLTELIEDTDDTEDPKFHVKESHFLMASVTSIAFVRSFASYNFSQCQCMQILDFTFTQLLEHSHEAGV